MMRTTARIMVAMMAGVTAGGVATPALASTGSGLRPARTSLGGPGHFIHRGADGEVDVNVCSKAVGVGMAHCDAHVRTDLFDDDVEPLPRGPNPPGTPISHAAIGNAGAYDPAFLQSAYNAPSATNGAGQTVAVVVAFDAPHIESNLATYRAQFHLPPCTTANGCFRKIDQNGGTNYPVGNIGWAEEAALDTQMVSAMCPNCDILLVEANNNSLANLGLAVNKAVELGADVVSNSYGANEWSGQTWADSAYFDHPGVAIVASSGDYGYGVSYPAAAPGVVAVGGTSLYQATNTGTRNATETVWAGAGSGCSAYEPKPVWQTDTGCANRSVADVAAVADPNTGVWVYDMDVGGWIVLGGTSVAAPIIGALYALAGNGPSTVPMASLPYATPGALNDVVSGSNGSCGGSYLCTGTAGYDGPTGLGTPNNVGALTPGGNVVIPTPPPPAPDFTITASKVNTPIRPGTTVTSTVTITPKNNFTGSVKLSAPTAPGAGLTRRYNSSTLAISGGARSATLVLTAQSGGTYTVNVTGTRGSIVHKVTLAVTVNDFSILVSPVKAKVARGGQARYTVKITPEGTFNAPVTLSVAGLPARDTVIYAQNPAGASSTQTVTIVTSPLDARGTRSVRFKGVNGVLNHTVTAVLSVQ